MNRMNNGQHDNVYQKEQERNSDIKNYQGNNKASNTDTRPGSENGNILEQILSDMAWYG